MFTAATVAAFLATDQLLLMVLLGADLAFRLMGRKELSVLHSASARVKQVFKMPTVNTDGGAKQVAGYFGMLFIASLVIGSILQLQVVVNVLAILYLGCLLMDTFMNFCLGCKIYHIYQMLK